MDVRSRNDLEGECGWSADFDGAAVAVLAAADEDAAGVEGEDVGDGERHRPVFHPRPGFHVLRLDMHHPEKIRLLGVVHQNNPPSAAAVARRALISWM